MQINNAKLLDILLKDVFGSITINLEKWEGLTNAQFSIGRTYFNDRFKHTIPLNRAAAERIHALYRHALIEGSGCSYDAKKISRKLCDVLESLIPGENFRHLIFLFSDTEETRSIKVESLLSILSLLLNLAENEVTPDLEKFRKSYAQELKLDIVKRLLLYSDSTFEKQKSSSIAQKENHPNPSSLKKKSELYSEMMQHLASDMNIVPEYSHTVSEIGKISLENSRECPVPMYSLSDSVIYPDAKFVGREAELDQIHRFLNSSNNKLFLFGMGGIGKSELARQYISRYRNEYRLVLWISANGTLIHTLADDYLFPIRGMSRLDYPNDSENDYFHRKCILLREISGNDVLVVLDNYDTDDDSGLNEFLNGTYTAIITTRILRRDSRLQEMPIPPLHNPDELRKLFQIEYIRLTIDEENECIYKLASLLGGHPLSIRLAASVMRDRRISPSRMIDILSNKKVATDRPALQTQEIIFNRIREFFSISGLVHEEIFLLKNLACIPLSGIVVTELFEWCEFENFDVLEKLIQKSWIIHNQLTDEIHLHPVIASVIQEQIRMDDRDVRTLLRQYRNHTHKVRQDSLSEKERLLRYGEYMSTIGFMSCEAQRNFLIGLGYMRNTFGHYTDAKNIFSKALLLCDQLVDRLEMYHKISQMELFTGNLLEGKTTALNGLEELGVHNIPDEELGHLLGCWKIELFMRLSGYCRKIKDVEQCIHYATKALETANKVFAEDFSLQNAGEYLYKNFHPSQFRGWIYYEYASGYIVKADLKQAEIFALKSLNEFNAIKDEWSANYTHTLRSYIFYMKGDKENALKEALKAYNVILPLYGKYAVGQNLLWLYQLYRDLGDEDKMKTVIAKFNYLYHDDYDAIQFMKMATNADFLWDYLDFDTFPIPRLIDLSKNS